MFINQDVIKSIVNNPKNYTLALRSRYNYSVDTLSVMYNSQENRYEVLAEIILSGYSNPCKLYINDAGEVIAYHCNCRWCDAQSGCAHIALLIMKLIELNPMTFPYYYNDEERRRDTIRFENEWIEKQRIREQKQRFHETEQFITQRKASYTYEITSMIQQKTFELLPVFSLDHFSMDPELSFKVGQEKKYVIKDIDDFLANVHDQGFHSYGAKLSFVHKLDAFDEFSQKQIAFMKQARLGEYSYYYKNKKSISINESIFDEFYDLYSSNDNLEAGFYFQDYPQKIAIDIRDEKDYYVVTASFPQHVSTGKKHFYDLRKEGNTTCIIRIPFDEKGHVVDLCSRLNDKDLWLPKASYADFYKYTLSDILPYITIHSPIEQVNTSYDGYIKLLGDIDEQEQISIILEYETQDDEKRFGFQEDNSANTLHQDMVETFIKQYASVIDYDAHTAYLDVNEDKTFEFLKEGLPYLGEYCDVFVSNALQTLGNRHTYTISVGVKVENNLLEIDVHSMDIPTNELKDVLKAYRKKKKFHRLKNGKLLYLESEELQEVDTLFADYNIHSDQIKNGTITMNAYRSFAINGSLQDTQHLKITREASFTELLQKFQAAQHTDIPLPDAYVPILRDYQKSGYAWLHQLRSYGFNGILADDMGLGKTLQVIALLESMASQENTSIVICPSSLIYNWEDEIHKFSKRLTCACVCGSRAQRKAIILDAKNVDILITSYDYIRRDIDIYENLTFFYIVLDEAQYIKNQKTKNASTVKQLKSEHRLALSGTPIENSLAELWSIFDFLMPDYLFNYHYFKAHYESAIVKENDEKKQKELKRLVTPFILRRNKKEVLTELPDKMESTLTIHFSEEERVLYFAHLAQVNKDLQALSHMDNVDKFAILAMLTKLRQLCCEPRLLFENITNYSSKFSACLELLHTFKENGQKVLLFSSFTSVLDLLAQALEKEGISYHLLTGQTNKEDRRDLVAKFQTDMTTVFLISLKAGGTGLNLTAAQGVIHFDPWWNISAQNQATDRAYRIGQDKNVQVYKFIMKDSIEEKIQKLQDRKKILADSFVENNEGSIGSMSTDDLLSLFKM